RTSELDDTSDEERISEKEAPNLNRIQRHQQRKNNHQIRHQRRRINKFDDTSMKEESMKKLRTR
ncbi:7846_t:CDS:1, partial [Racocetra fulgida]